MLRLLVILLTLSILANLAVFLKALDYRKKMIMAWAQTHHWVDSYQQSSPPPVQETQPTLVLLGASITAKWDVSDIARGRRIINMGIDGQYSGQLLLRFKHDVIDLKPEGVLIKLCEMNFSHDVPETISMDNLVVMATLAQANNIRPYLATTIPVSRGLAGASLAPEIINQRIKSFNDGVRAFARQHSFPLVDLATAMSDQEGYLFEHLAVDGVHPSKEGYKIMTQVLKTVLAK
jgi:lysophospholipase L1-like esterase